MSDKQAVGRIGELIAGKYRLERLLGAGGMGAVYGAKHEFTKRSVAVKLMHEAFASSQVFAERFVREAQAPSTIGHPGIVEVLDGGFDEGGALYLVLEMLQGKTLGDLEIPLSVPDLVDVVTQLLDALGAAHKAGFVHRDIKPDNVFLTHDAQGRRRVKLLDFGVAGFRDATGPGANLTQTGTVLGTPTFMSPEQARGDRVDQRSDLWAVGAILYEALAGKPPHDAETYNAVIVSIVTREHVPLERLRPDLPRALLEVIEGALRKDLIERWQSAAEMIAALRAIPNLEALSGVVTRPASAEGVAETQAARPRRPAPTPSIEAPVLKRPSVTIDEVAPPQQPSVGLRPARAVTTLADPEAPAPRIGIWVGGALVVIALAVGAAIVAKNKRTQPQESVAVAASVAAPTSPAVAAPPASSAPVATPAAPTQAEAQPIPAVEEPAAPAIAPADQPPSPSVKPLGSQDLTGALNAVQPQLQRCYQQVLAAELAAGSSTPTAVSLDITLTVAPSGEVRDVDITGNAPSKLTTCMREPLRTVMFRETNEAAELNFPVVFQPSVVTR